MITPAGRREIAALLAVEDLAPGVLTALERLYERLGKREAATSGDERERRPARRLATAAPSALLAGGVGATLGTMLGVPGFAASGAGIVLGGIAINLTSALVQELWLAQDDTRADVVERGLAERDADMTTLAAALLHAEPDLALALSDSTRTELVAGLERAMHEAGGPLDAIAPRYLAALREPQTDWLVLQAALRQTIHDTRMLMEVGHEGVISGGTQRAENTAGRVDMTMRGGDRAARKRGANRQHHAPAGPNLP